LILIGVSSTAHFFSPKSLENDIVVETPEGRNSTRWYR